MENYFKYESMEIVIKDRVTNNMNLIKVVHREHKKDKKMFFSRISEYNQIGFIFNNSFHLLKQYMKCINCYSNYENNEKCNFCNYEYSDSKPCFFLNCRNIMPTKAYNNLRRRYNLNTISEQYYDQRHAMSRFLKMEIYEKALHPDRIEKILAISNDSWLNIDKYI